MRMLIPRMITWTTAALLLTVSVVAAIAQIQTRGTSALHAQMQNATPLVRPAACRGWGPVLSARNDPSVRTVPLLVRTLLLISGGTPPDLR